MILNVTALVLVLGITFLHSIFGLFSGLLNVFCAIAAAAVALGCFEALNDLVTAEMGLHPSYSGPGCLIVLFILTHVGLRFAADTFLRGNVRVALPADIAGGIICGFVIGEITVGILVLGLLMLPFGGRVMMFSRYERTDDVDQRGRVRFARNDIWLNPDGFVVGLVNTLSSGSLKRGDSTFASAYPDFREWVFWTGNTVQQESMTAPARDKDGDGHEGLKVESWWEVTGPVAARYRKDLPTRRKPDPPYSPQNYEKEDDRNRLIVVRLAMQRSAADRSKRQVFHRFRPSMIRLVGTVPEAGGAGRLPTHYIPQILGGADPKIGGSPRIVDLDNNFALAADGTTRIDAYFEVDERFEPSFVEYRRHARANLGVMAESASEEQLTLAQEDPRARRGGPRMSFLSDVQLRRSGDNAELPFPISVDTLARMGDVQGGEFVSGRVIGLQDDLSTGSSQQVRNFRIPPGFRICQVRCKARQAQSLFGQVFNFVRGTVNQYTAIDKQGNEYPLAGYYAVVKRDGRNFLELYFTGDPDSDEATAFRQMLDFKNVKIRELTASDDAILGLMFLVRPGKVIYEIRTQDGKKLDVPDYSMKGG